METNEMKRLVVPKNIVVFYDTYKFNVIDFIRKYI